MKKKNKKSLNRESYVACLIVGIVTLLCAFPVWVVLVNSFSTEIDITLNGFAIIPRTFTFDNFKYLVNNKGTMLFRAIGISVVTLVLGTIYTLTITVCFAYALAQDEKVFPLKNFLAFFAWFTTVFSGGIIPWYILTTRYYGLSNNLWALFIPNGLSVFNMFVVRNAFKAVPRELIEAAKIDGASNLKVFFKIAIPLAKVGICTIALFTALGYWNDFHLSLYLTTKTEYQTMQKMLYSMMADISALLSGSESVDAMEHITLPANTAKLVLTVLTLIPVGIIFPFFQRFFVKGITVGAVKG